MCCAVHQVNIFGCIKVRPYGSRNSDLHFSHRSSSDPDQDKTLTMSSTAQARLAAMQNHLSIQPCFQRHAIHNDKPTGPADLARERAGASFNVEGMTEIILRGKENVDTMVRNDRSLMINVKGSI